jgi:hypothetical protein
LKRFLLLIFFLFSTGFVLAQTDDVDNPNDPRVNETANACFEGGAMEGKCATEWEWVCGWYMIRLDYGIFSREEIPGSCAILLPPLPESTPYVPPTAGCVSLDPNYNLDFDGGNYLPYGAPLYWDTACTIVFSTTPAMAYAPNGMADALAICKKYGYNHAVHWIYTPVYHCQP